MNKILKVYKILFKEFGPQNWWPTTPKNKSRPEYRRKSNLSEKEKWEIVTGAILTQNTSWKNVESAIINLNKAGFFDNVFSFNLQKIERLVKPSGFYRQKARYLKNFIDFIKKKHKKNLGSLLNLEKEKLRSELLRLKGIGPETADSIILYAARKPSFVVDAYTMRILNRLGIDVSGYNDVKLMFEKKLKKNFKVFSEYHALLVKVGKSYCKKTKPLCPKCPLFRICGYGIS